MTADHDVVITAEQLTELHGTAENMADAAGGREGFETATAYANGVTDVLSWLAGEPPTPSLLTVLDLTPEQKAIEA